MSTPELVAHIERLAGVVHPFTGYNRQTRQKETKLQWWERVIRHYGIEPADMLNPDDITAEQATFLWHSLLYTEWARCQKAGGQMAEQPTRKTYVDAEQLEIK